jgi:ankyrin repeat protein
MLRCAAVMLVALSWSSLAFCGEIHDAARDGNLEKVKALIKNNPDLVFSKDDKYNGQTPLHAAVLNRHKDVAELLLASNADVNAQVPIVGLTPLLIAAGGGYPDVVKLLRQHGGQE